MAAKKLQMRVFPLPDRATHIYIYTDITEIPTAEPTFLRSSILLGLMRILCDKTGSVKIQDGGLNTSNACISASRQDITKFQRLCLCFRGLAFHWDIREDYATKPELENSKMAASELQMHVTPLPDKISTKFQRLYLRF